MDGKEYEFIATAGSMWRLRRHFSQDTAMKPLSERDMVEFAIPLFWESRVNRDDGHTFETFMDILPFNIGASVGLLLEASGPEQKDRPTSGSRLKTVKAAS